MFQLTLSTLPRLAASAAILASFAACASTGQRTSLSPASLSALNRYAAASPYANTPYSVVAIARATPRLESISTEGVNPEIARHIRYATNAAANTQASMARGDQAAREARKPNAAARWAAGQGGEYVVRSEYDNWLGGLFGNYLGETLYDWYKDNQAKAAYAAEVRHLPRQTLGVIESEITLFKKYGQPVPHQLKENRYELEDILDPPTTRSSYGYGVRSRSWGTYRGYGRPGISVRVGGRGFGGGRFR